MKSVTFSDIERVRTGAYRSAPIVSVQRMSLLALCMSVGLPALVVAFHLIDPTAPIGYIVLPVLLGGLLPTAARSFTGRFEVTTRFSACHLVGTLDGAMVRLGYGPTERSPGSVRYRAHATSWPQWQGAADITVTVRDHLLEVTGPMRTLRALRRQLSC